MNIKDLRPASSLARRYGVKCVVYGGPGSGKTPLIKTAPRPILLVVEPGMLSARSKEFDNIPAFEAFTADKIDDFFKWFFESKEAANFDTLGVDSITQVAEIFLNNELARNKDGRRAYGEMARNIKTKLDTMYYFPNKHIYLIAKQGEEDTTKKKRPYFPGQELNVYAPHLFDEILHIGLETIPGIIKPTPAFRTKESFDFMARDRSGNLNEFEPTDLNLIFNKVMA